MTHAESALAGASFTESESRAWRTQSAGAMVVVAIQSLWHVRGLLRVVRRRRIVSVSGVESLADVTALEVLL